MLYYIKPSLIHGVGVFAGRFLHEGELVRSPTSQLVKSQRNYLPGFQGFNHSCSPNAEIAADDFEMVLRNIQKDEEVTLFYGPWMKSHCNCQVCRRP